MIGTASHERAAAPTRRAPPGADCTTNKRCQPEQPADAKRTDCPVPDDAAWERPARPAGACAVRAAHAGPREAAWYRGSIFKAPWEGAARAARPASASG